MATNLVRGKYISEENKALKGEGEMEVSSRE